MAKKIEETISMIDTFAEFKNTKNIDRTTLMGVLEESFRSVIAKLFGTDDNFDVIVNPDKGDLQIYQRLTIVEDDQLVDPNKEITLSKVHEDENTDDLEVGEEYSKTINFADFGRRNILTLKQTLASKILELEHDQLYNNFKDRIGQIISAEVYQVWVREMLLIDDEGNEMLLPKSNQIPGDFFKKTEMVRAVIDRVDNHNGKPKVYLSRTSPVFLQRMLESEVPEIHDGLITIKRIARIPGQRAKIAVESYDERIDAIGACVGTNGMRIRGIVKELRNETIDVISFSNNNEIFIARALSPAKISSMVLDDENHKAEIYLERDQVSLAIGKGGLNIKLASILSGYVIDVYSTDKDASTVEDIRLDEFSDEIDQWIIDAIKGIGLTTARSVLNAPRMMLIEKADLEEDTVDDIIRILKAEFEEE